MCRERKTWYEVWAKSSPPVNWYRASGINYASPEAALDAVARLRKVMTLASEWKVIRGTVERYEMLVDEEGALQEPGDVNLEVCLCLFDGVIVRTDDGCPLHSKRPGRGHD